MNTNQSKNMNILYDIYNLKPVKLNSGKLILDLNFKKTLFL